MPEFRSLKQPLPPAPDRDEQVMIWKFAGKWRWRASVFIPGDSARTFVAEGREFTIVVAALKAQAALHSFWQEREA